MVCFVVLIRLFCNTRSDRETGVAYGHTSTAMWLVECDRSVHGICACARQPWACKKGPRKVGNCSVCVNTHDTHIAVHTQRAKLSAYIKRAFVRYWRSFARFMCSFFPSVLYSSFFVFCKRKIARHLLLQPLRFRYFVCLVLVVVCLCFHIIFTHSIFRCWFDVADVTVVVIFFVAFCLLPSCIVHKDKYDKCVWMCVSCNGGGRLMARRIRQRCTKHGEGAGFEEKSEIEGTCYG